jgi:hypothetical protein
LAVADPSSKKASSEHVELRKSVCVEVDVRNTESILERIKFGLNQVRGLAQTQGGFIFDSSGSEKRYRRAAASR